MKQQRLGQNLSHKNSGSLINSLRRTSILKFAFVLFGLFLTSCAVQKHSNLKQTDYFYTTSIAGHEVQIRAVAENSLEVLYIENTEQPFPSFAKAGKNNLPLTVVEASNNTTITQGKLTAVIRPGQTDIAFYREGQLLTTQIGFDSGQAVGFDFVLTEDEFIMGGGERVLGMNRRGHTLPLYNRADYGYETESIQMNYSLPVVMSNQHYYLLFDNTAKGTLDIGDTEKNTLQFDAVGGRSSYIIGTEATYPEIIDDYTQVTGRPALLPRWALGHFISRFGYRTEQEVREVVALTQAADIPADSVIIDLYWFGQGIKGHMGNLAWDKEHFPTPKAMIDDLRAAGIKTIPITEPFILTTSERWQDAIDDNAIATTEQDEPYRFDFYFGNTGLIDIFSQEGRDWFADRYTELFKQGAAGTWGDLGEPEVHPDDIQHRLTNEAIVARGDEVHNVYGHEWARLVYETQQALQPDTRPFILMRSGFAGSQRFGMIPWTGDVNRTWGGLKPQVELSLQMGLFGLGLTHSDLGGFAGGEQFNKELYIRWLQYGVFQPIYRPHAQDAIASELVYHDDETINILRDYIKLRYRLTPYLYNLLYKQHQTGMPLMRPMFFTDETNPELLAIKDQYLWGDAFLVKPITEPGNPLIDVMLPEGQWFNFWTDDILAGNQNIQFMPTLETIPVYVKAGSFVPMVDELNNLDDYSTEKLGIHYYHHESVTAASYELFEDDGQSASSVAESRYELMNFASKTSDDVLTISLKHNINNKNMSYVGQPQKRQIEIVIHGLNERPETIYIGDKPLPESQVVFAKYGDENNILKISFDWQHEPTELAINLN